MSKAIQRFSLDVTHPDVQASVRIMQGDDNRQWRFTFTEAGRPFDLPARCTAMLAGTKPDDTVLENGLVVQGNEVIYDFGAADPENGIEQISTVPGSFEVQILLFDEYGAVLHAPRLWVTVFSSSYTERMANVSMDQFGGIKELIARLVGMEGNVETLLTRLTSQGTVTIAPEQWTDAAPFRADVFMPDDVFGKGCVVLFAPEDDATKDAAGKAMLSMTIGGTVDQNTPSPDYVVIARAESGEAPTIPLNFRYVVLKTGTEDKALVAMIGVDAVGAGGASGGGNASVKSGYVSIPVSDWKDSSPTSATIHIDGFETGSVCLLTPADSETKTASEEARLGTIPSSGISNSVFIRAQAGKVPTTQLNFKYMILRSEDDTGAPLAAIIGIDAAGSAEAGGVDETAVKNIIKSVVPEWARASTKPTYNKDEVGLGNVDNVKQYSGSNPPDYPVDSVNGKTGAVKLNADDVGARSSSWMPTAAQVGADPSGMAATKVSDHDTYTGSHNDIRLLIKALQEQVNKFLDVDDTTRDELSEVLALIDANAGTLESLTSSKVNVADIINDLTTNVTNKPLSAAQGVELKKLIDALNGAILYDKGQELTEGQQTQARENIGAVKSWNELEDKPFGEAGGDTLTWDGNTEGRVSVLDAFCKISDAVPTEEYVVGKQSTIRYSDGSVSHVEFFDIGSGALTVETGVAVIVPASGVGVDLDGFVFPEKGIYFMFDSTVYIESVTIPNYTGFPIVKKIDEKYLPPIGPAIEEALAEAKASGDFKGDPGTSVTIKSISESDESGGENVVTFSDGKTMKVKNGRDGNGKNVSVPDYWRDAVNAMSDTIKERQNEAGAQAFQFVWFSDPHGVADYKTNDTITSRVTDIGRVTQYAAEKFDIPFVAISGDIMSQASHSSASSVLAEYEAIREILAPIDRDRLIYGKGNHDGAWFAANGVSYLKNIGGKAIFNAIYRRQALERSRVFGGDGSYFYTDDSASKVRFVMLNCHTDGDGSVDANGYAVYNSMKNSVYGTEQLTWLAKTALDLPEGWGAVIMAHQPLIDSKDGDVLNGILKAYNNKTTYNGSVDVSGDYWGKNVTDNTYKIVTADVNFASAKGEIIAMFVGHRHQDLVFAAADYGYACPVIVITTAGADVRGTNTNYDRVVGTATETAMDIVTVDRNNEKVYCTRLGAGVDRIISYSGATIVTYSIANTLTNCKNSNGVSTVEAGKTYSGTITANEGYKIDSVRVTMGGTDITSTVYNNGVINIPSVTGNIAITASAVKAGASYTNLFDPSQDGYEAWNGSKMYTNWMPYGTYIDENGDSAVYHFKGWSIEQSPYKYQIAIDTKGTENGGLQYTWQNGPKLNLTTSNYDSNVRIFQPQSDAYYRYIRFEFREDVAANLIITANEDIVN